MTINVAQIQRLRCYIEPNGSLGVDHSATLGDFFDVPAIEGSVEFSIDPHNLDKKFLRQNRDQWAGNLRGFQTATLSFEMPWCFSTIRSVAGGTPAAIVATPTSKILAAWLGGVALGTSMDAAASCTASTIKTADHANAVEGCGVAWADANGIMHARKVARKDGSNDLILDQALPSAPLENDYVYRGIDLYLADRNTANCTTFQFLLEGADYSDDCWLLQGGQCTTAAVLNIKNGERPTWKFTFEFALCQRKEGLLASQGNVVYVNVNERLVSDGVFTAYAIDTANPYTPVSVKTNMACNEISFDFGNCKRQKITSPGGFGNVAAYIISGESPKLTGKFTLPFETNDETFLDLYDSSGLIAINMQVGSSETYGCGLITIPAAQITNWQVVRKNGIVEQEISWSAKLDCQHYTSVDTATELSNAPFKIYMF